jgi:hypothetical protein
MTEVIVESPVVEALAIVDEALYELRATNLIETMKMMDYLLDVRLLLSETLGDVER